MNSLIRCLALACLTSGCATSSFDVAPLGVQHYRYELTERAPNQPDRGYRVDYLLQTTRQGVVAIIRHAQEWHGGQWQDVDVSVACAANMHAQQGELARVTLAPIDPQVAANMSDAFLADCAPAAIFYPITDILNVSLVQTGERFGLRRLHVVGDHVRFASYRTQFERLGVAISVAAPGGETRLTTLDHGVATVDWLSDPLQVNIVHRATATERELTLSGVENFGFRLLIDTHTGVLQRATTTADTLELMVSMPGLPVNQAPHIHVTRDVTIDRIP